MTDRSQRNMHRLTAWARSPRGGALLAALLTLAILLPLWALAIDWYRSELLSAEPGQRSLLIFEAGGLMVMVLAAGLVFLSVNRQALLSQAVHERTREITRVNRHLEEDLAQRRRMEEELRRSDERYRALARSFPNGAVFLFDADLRYTLADGAGLAEVGLSKETLEGLTIWEALPPDTIEVVDPHYRAALAGQSRVFEMTFGEHLFLARTLPLRDDRGDIIAGMAVIQDITERKRAEQSLHRWAHMFEHAEWGVAIGSADGRTLEMMNPAYAKMHGYTVEELSGMPIGSVFAPGTADELSALIRTANETGHAVIESKHVRKDGAIFPVLVDLTTVKDEQGQLLYRVANVQDITDRKRAEDELRANEARLRVVIEQYEQLVNSIDGIVWEGNAQTLEFSFVSRQAERILGYPAERWMSEPAFWKDHIHPADRDRAVNGCAFTAAEKRAHEFEYRMLAADGRIVWLRDTVTVVVEKEKPKLLRGLMIDITERKQVEEALRERELQYRNIFESNLDGLFINDLDGRLVDFNPAAAHMHGYTVDEFRQIQPREFIHSDSLPLLAAFTETIKAGQEYHCRAVDVRKDGSLFHVEVSGTPFTLRGQPHAFAIVRDISVQVEAERLLEQRVAERTRELSTLLDVSRNVASTLELEPLLGLILDQLKTLVGYDGAALLTLHGGALVVQDYRGPIPREQALQGRFLLEQSTIDQEIIRRREPIIIGDVRDGTGLAAAFRESVGAHLGTFFGYVRSWLAVPLLIKERTIGIMALDHLQPQYYTDQHARLALAIANQAAIAIENARLFADAQGKAVLEERQRLARDLHDSVTQSLYSLTLLAEAGRRLIDLDVPQATRYLSDIGEIAQQSLKEMRLLVYQLRPLALEHEGLIGALQARLDSVEKRAGIEARFLIEGNLGSLPPALEEGLFRIAQEALNNALKHAAARAVAVRLRGDEECVTLEVADDGRGLALLTTDVKGGLGLTSIKERVAQLQGALTIDSAPDEGTRISVEAPRLLKPATLGTPN